MPEDMFGEIVKRLSTMPVDLHGTVMNLLVELEDPRNVTAIMRFLRMRKENPLPVVATNPLWRWVEDSHTAIEVNLTHPGTLPFVGAEPGWCWGQRVGWMRVELKDDNLYVGRKKVVLHCEPAQTTDRITGEALFGRFEGRNPASHLHPNVLEAGREAGILPESWKVDSQGRTRYIFAWAKGFYNPGTRRLSVRYVDYSNGAWRFGCRWLEIVWTDECPAAVLGEKKSLAA